MIKNGTDLNKIRKYFFSEGGSCLESIEASKSFIVAECNITKKSIWDVVEDNGIGIDSDKDLSDYQKNMLKSSLLLAWEELERDHEEVCFEIQDNSKK